MPGHRTSHRTPQPHTPFASSGVGEVPCNELPEMSKSTRAFAKVSSKWDDIWESPTPHPLGHVGGP